jgi:cell division transport system ATP-binding protein
MTSVLFKPRSPEGLQSFPTELTSAVPATSLPMIQLRGVIKSYPQSHFSLMNLSLEVRQGDFLFITGPSGSGKSTLLKLIYGEERAEAGEVIVDQVPVSRLKGNQLASLRRRLGVVFQDYKLIPQRTVAENVALVLRSQGVPRQEIERRLDPTLKLVGLHPKAHCFPTELSGGEQQRVSIARAVIGTPKVLLADEPTGNLDPDNAHQVVNILNKLNSFGVTVLVTTHDANLIQAYQHPVVRLEKGRLKE